MLFLRRSAKTIEIGKKMNFNQPMKVRLAYKLFGAFSMIMVIVVGTMLLSRHLFFINFKNYIHQMEQEELERLIPTLQAHYRTHASWDGLNTDPGYWGYLMRTGPDHAGPHLPSDDHRRPPAPPFSPPDKPPHGPPGLVLLDADNRQVIGKTPPDGDRQLLNILVDGHIVGRLGLEQRDHFPSGPPAVLIELQNKQTIILGSVMVTLAALITIFFSRHLLRPIKRLAQGTQQLADRDFTTRIQHSTSDELGQLADNFNTMAQTLETYEKIRRQWLTDISHELRTPLAVLRAEIEALQDGVRDATPENLSSLHAEILRINRLVEDLHLLALADSDRLKMAMTPLKPAGLLEKVAQSFETRYARRQISIAFLLDKIQQVRIKGDEDRLEQVFANILENGCKYIHSKGVLKLVGDSDDRFLTIEFHDSGPGVPEGALPHLFDRLYRVENSRSRETGGSGLGLSISRQIVEQHKGTIQAEHSPTGGLCIKIRLPLGNV